VSHFTVVYDACVLFPAPLRDFLMHLAMSNLFRAKWPDEIHEEWIRNVLKERPDLSREKLQRTRQNTQSQALKRYLCCMRFREELAMTCRNLLGGLTPTRSPRLQ